MNKRIENQATKFAKEHGRKRQWHKALTMLAAMVVFVTTYVLIMPAVTMQGKTYCGTAEHKHSDACFAQANILVCTLSEEGHTHTDSCYKEQPVLTCGLEETEGHTHSAECYRTESMLVCTQKDHEHDAACYKDIEVLVCGKEECAPHAHGDACYRMERVLVCGKQEQAPHVHSDACYCIGTDEAHPICGKEEHEHTLQCYSDPDADVESASVWEKTFASVELSENWDEDVLAIAETQLGYAESTRNYQVQEDGTTMMGYTRYGAWYGMPYEDWCAMFCSFCLNYAEVDPKLMPREASCVRWIEKLSELGIFRGDEAYTPKPGDLIFFDRNSDGTGEHVGFVCDVTEATENSPAQIKTIEGNSSDCVEHCLYDADDDGIFGYGILPENPELSDDEAEAMREAPMMLMSMGGATTGGVTWEITPASDGSYILYIGGSGAIPANFLANTTDLSNAMAEIMANNNTVSLVIGKDITSIGSDAFNTPAEKDTNGIITSVTFEDNSKCTTIGNSAFRAMLICESIDFGTGGAFETFGPYAFYRNSALKNVNLENCRHLTDIGDYAFAEYNKIEEITIPESVVRLGDHAFGSCKSLKTVDFERNPNLNYIGVSCFDADSALSSINFENLTNSNIDVGNNAKKWNGGNVLASTTALKEVTIPSGFRMNYYCMFHYSGIEKITFLENSNVSSYESTFAAHSKLYELDLRPLKGLKSPSSIFYDADTSNLHTLWFPSSVTTISSTGGNLPKLRNIYFDENSQLEKISGSFYGNDALQEIDLSELSKLKTITNSFRDDPELKTIKLPNNGQAILLDMSFHNCPSLEEIDLTDTSVKQLSAVFYDDENLKRVALPTSFITPYGTVKNDDGTYTKKGIFYNDPALEDLYINSDVNGSNNATIWYSDDSFVNCAPFTLHLGADIDNLPLEFLQDASRSCGDILFAGNNNITFTKYEEAEHTGANLPSMLSDLSGEYYADAQGVLYKLNSDGTATLTYVPAYIHQNKWDETPLTAYTIPASITDAKGVTYNVTSVRPDAFLLAENLARLTVDGTAYTGMTDAAAALSTEYGVTADLDRTRLDGASGPQHEDPDEPGYDPHYPEGGNAVRNAIIEEKDLTTLTISTSTNASTAPAKPDQYELFTNENAEIVVSLSNEATVPSKIARTYFAFDSDDYFLSNFPLDTPQTSTTEGKTFIYVLRRIEGTDTYYLDIGPVDEGSTGSLTFKPQFSSPETDGGRLKVWGEVIDSTTQAPNTAIPDDKDCQIIEWITKPDPFTISKTADNAQKLIRRGNTEGETAEYDLTGLSYTIELTRGGNYLDVGKNYVDYVEFTDILTLPEDIIWRDGVFDAIRNGSYSITGGTTKTLSVTLDGTEYTVATVKATDMRTLTPEITSDGKLKLRWTVVNSSETIEYSMGKATVVFGDEVLMLDPAKTYEEPETIQIDNHAESDVYYNYATADQYKTTVAGQTVDPYRPYHTEADAPVSVTTGKGDIKLTKSLSANDYWGSPSTWTIKASNPTAFPYEGLGRVEDPIGRYITIHPDGMARMFAEDEYKELTITITKATLCLGNGITTYPTETVTTVDGSTTAQTSIQDSTVDAYEAYHGTENLNTWSGDVITGNNRQAYTVAIRWKSDGTGLELSYSGPSNGTVDIGAPTEANIDAALESIHFLTDNETYYNCKWISEGDRTTLDAHETRTFHIYANNKNTFEYIVQDHVGQYGQTSHTYPAFTNYANAYATESTKLIAQSGGVTQSSRTRELILSKSMSQNGVAFTEDTKLEDDHAIENTVKLTHYGIGSYDLLPVVDHMSGSQIAMAPVSDNTQLASAGLDTATYNGKAYYLLTKPGTYHNVWMGGYCADSVTVTNTASGLDTITKWYFKDTSPRAWTINISYPTWVSYSGSGATGGSFEIKNEVWAGDHPTHRLYASMIGRGSALDFNKFIVDTKDRNELKEYTPIGVGEKVLYRLQLICTGERTVTGKQIYDALPDTFGAFEWTDANVQIAGYGSTNGRITLTRTPAEGGPVTASPGIGTANRISDIGGWCISSTDPVTGKVVDGQHYILWDDDFTVNYSGADYLDIFVELTFPDTEGSADKWGDYCLAAGGKSVYNTFYLDGLPDTVHHDLKAPIKARLQKGVVNTGFFSAPLDSGSWYPFPYVARDETSYYSNDGSDTAQRVSYYVNLYNEGPGRLYIDTIQDVLPEGFTYYSLTTAQSPYAYVYECGLDRSYKRADYGRTEYYLYTTSTSQVRDVTSASYYKVGTKIISTYETTPLSKMIADNVEYVIADITVDASGRTADGRQIVKATVSNSGASTCTLAYDETAGKYYLEANQCLRFGYNVNTNGYAKTKDVETNTVTMPVYDPYATGLTVSETVATANNSLDKNDGGCDLKLTPLISEQGFDTAGYPQSEQWLVSDVTVRRDAIQPGLDKADTTIVRYNADGTVLREDSSDGNLNYGDGVIWTLTSTNSGESTLHDYTITDTMPAPFQFKGPVYINVYDETHLRSNPSYGNAGNKDMPLVSSGNTDVTKVTSSNAVTSVIRPLFRLDRGENGSCTLAVRNGGTYVNIPLTSGQTVKVGGTGGDVPGLDLYRYRNNGNTRGELIATNFTSRTIEVTWTKTDAGETLQIHFASPYFDIPAHGSMTLEYETREMASDHVNQTYYNEAWLTPTQSFTKVAQGRDTTLDGEHSVYDAEPVNLISGYSTVSYKTVTEVLDPANTASSGDQVNYIDLPDTDSLFDYGLNVTGPSERMETFVLIDNLPEVGDHATFVDSVPRNSPFKVSLADDPNFRLYVQTSADADYVLQDASTYTIDYSTKNAAFDRADWESTSTWSAAAKDTRSIRLTMHDVPANARIRLVYTAKIDGDAEPGTIAWNNFGYSYRVDVTGAPWLNATPPNVGIRVPSAPTLQKKLELDGEPIPAHKDAAFTFCVYKGAQLSGLEGMTESAVREKMAELGRDYRIYTLDIAEGDYESEVLSLKENGFWVDQDYYNLVELDPGEDFEFVSINYRTQPTYRFQYSQQGNNFEITAVNRRSAWEILLTKLDARDNTTTLSDAVFGLYSRYEDDKLMLSPETEDGEPVPYTGDDATVIFDGTTYYLTNKATTGPNGQIKWAQLYRDDYIVAELEAPLAYTKTDELFHMERDNEEDIILLPVTNETGYELPDAGGIGTTPLYALGVLLIMAATLMYGFSMRRKRERRGAR